MNGQQSYGNLYVIAAAARGGGKSTAAGILAKPLMTANDELSRKFLPTKTTLEARAGLLGKQIEGLFRRATKPSEDQSELLKELETKKLELAEVAPDGLPILTPSLLEGNSTSEALAASLRAGDQSILSYSPEAGDLVRVVLGKYNKGEQGDFDRLLSAWSSEPVVRNRVSSGRNSLTPTMSALWFAQPFILKELIGNEEAFQLGLTARPLIFDSKIALKHDDGVAREVPGDVTEAWHKHIWWLVRDRPSKMPSLDVRCSPDAREVFRRFHNDSIDLRCGDCADVEGELSGWRENAVRVALNLWLADGHGGEITAGQAERAVTIVRWCGSSYLTILTQGRAAQKFSRVQALRGILVNTPERAMTLRDLSNRHGYEREEIRALAAEFPDMLELETRTAGSQGGRPSEFLRLPASTNGFRRF